MTKCPIMQQWQAVQNKIHPYFMETWTPNNDARDRQWLTWDAAGCYALPQVFGVAFRLPASSEMVPESSE